MKIRGLAMRYVIIDLEWNNVYVKRLKGFINEIIEVGAVMLDDSLQEMDTFSCLVKSQISKKLNSRVEELTHLTNEELAISGVSFQAAMKYFSHWLNDKNDVIVLSWGNGDIRSLLDNYRFFMETETIPFLHSYIDLQSYCQGIVASQTLNQVGLSAAAEKIGIDLSLFHNHRALDDSRLAAECLRQTFDIDKIKRYTEACDDSFFRRLLFKSVLITDLDDPKIDHALMRCKCERCGKDMELFHNWSSTKNGFRSVFICHSCKIYKRCTIRFVELTGGMDIKISYRTAHELTEADHDTH